MNKFRSGYEKKIYEQAISLGRQLVFEPPDAVVRYNIPTRTARYIVDFRLDSGILVESKGRLTAKDRAKMLLVKADNPGLDIRFLFQRANNRITKSPKSLTYGEWATKHGFPWSEGTHIPEEWFNIE